jgi:uncharacterized membrane protein
MRNGKITTINYPATQGVTCVNGINDQGQLVGVYTNSPVQQVDGFVWTAGKFEHLRYPGAQETHPQAIDKQGRIVGWYGVPNGLGGLQTWGFTLQLP